MQIQRRRLPIKGLISYLFNRKTPPRVLTESVLADKLPLFKGNVCELGGVKSLSYQKFATNADNYIVTNVTGKYDLYADMLQLPFEDESIDNYVCIAVMEHIPDAWKVASEIKRTLRRGGKLLLVVPFMYPIHKAPDDFIRFTPSFLSILFSGLRIDTIEQLGGKLTLVTLMMQCSLIARLIGVFLYLIDCFSPTNDDYALLYSVLAEKT